ncbi:MAG: hypothetical protein JEZ14_11310 [Marinilabiliaceae bacterium]|nr:hypothetical protein [Marinilabiliaceae bacterium]
MNKIYLAGGMKSGWQDQIIEKFKGRFVFYNPRYHGLIHPGEYTTWDRHYVKKCDILFAFMESDNPSGFGLTLEIGLAKSLNKTIILIDEKSKEDESFAKRFAIVRELADVVFEDILKAEHFLNSFLNISK